MRLRPSMILSLGLAAVLGLAACGSATEKLTEEAIERSAGEDADVDIDFDGDGGSFSAETDDGSFEYDISGEGGGDLPDDFPDVPVPDGLDISSSGKQSSGDETAWSVTGTIEADAEEFFADVIDDYESAGFEVEGQYENSTNDSFNGGAQFVGDDHQVSFNVFGDGSDGTTVSLTVVEAPQE